MKVLTLTQPFAHLVCIGAKLIETRGWKITNQDIITQIKNEGILIHAGLSKSYKNISCRELCYTQPFNQFVDGGNEYDQLSFGKIIGHVKFTNFCSTDESLGIYMMESWRRDKWRYERRFGDYSPGRYGWLLSDPVLFKEPIPAKGQLNLWNYDGELPELESSIDYSICDKCGHPYHMHDEGKPCPIY